MNKFSGSTAQMNPIPTMKTELGKTTEKDPVIANPSKIEGFEADQGVKAVEAKEITQIVEDGKGSGSEAINPQLFSANSEFVDNSKVSGTFGLAHKLLKQKKGDSEFSVDIIEVSND